MCSDICNEGITQFYLPPTYKPYLPLLPSRKASPTLVLIAPTHRMDGWLYTKINVQHRELNLDIVTHPSSNRARRRLISLPPLRQTSSRHMSEITCTVMWCLMGSWHLNTFSDDLQVSLIKYHQHDYNGWVLFDWSDPVGPDLVVLFHRPQVKWPARPGPTMSGQSKRTQPIADMTPASTGKQLSFICWQLPRFSFRRHFSANNNTDTHRNCTLQL